MTTRQRFATSIIHWTLTMCVLLAPMTCGGASEQGTRRDTAAGTVSGDTGTATTAPSTTTGTSEVSYDVDPNDVRAALRFDSATNTVTYPIVAGLTSNNSAWNFNGYADGEMTIVVPLNAKVVMPFSNLDGNVPHSFGVIAGTGSTADLAAAPDRQPALPGAITRRYVTGLGSRDRDIVRFTANQAGEFLLVCGVPGHAPGGMWIRFVVSADAQRPEIQTRD